MNKFTPFLFIGFIVMLAACKKETLPGKHSHNTSIQQSIAGKWELRRMISGIKGIRPPEFYAPGNGNILELTNINTYTLSYQHSIIHAGSFTMGNDPQFTPSDFLILDGMGKTQFEIVNDTLTIAYGNIYADGIIVKRVKL